MKKTCRQCKRTLTLAHGFYRQVGYADGHMKVCRRCHIAYVSANQELKFEYYKAYKRAWALRPENVEKRRAYNTSPQGREVHRASCRRYIRLKKILNAGAPA